MMRPMRSLTIFLVGSASTFAAWDLFRFFGSLTACLARIHFSGFTGLGNMPRDLPGPATRFTILLGFFSRFGKGRLGSFEFNWSLSFKDGKFLFAGDNLSCPFSRFGNDLCRITDKCLMFPGFDVQSLCTATSLCTRRMQSRLKNLRYVLPHFSAASNCKGTGSMVSENWL